MQDIIIPMSLPTLYLVTRSLTMYITEFKDRYARSRGKALDHRALDHGIGVRRYLNIIRITDANLYITNPHD